MQRHKMSRKPELRGFSVNPQFIDGLGLPDKMEGV